ncbi:MAG: hypothetical protein NVS4B3_03460 [Gemmatimonadaceae bacterium]
MTTWHIPRGGFALLITSIATVACNSSTGPRATRPVLFRMSSAAVSRSTSQTAGPLELTSARLAIGRAALGNGDQFGCVDCQNNDNDDSAEDGVHAQVVDVPLHQGTVVVGTEQVAAGRYTQAEISLETLASGALPAGWPAAATIEIGGRFNGTPFRLSLAVHGSFRTTLNPPVDVLTGNSAPSVAITLALPVSSWFTMNGAPLDPSIASQRAQIEANIRAAFVAEAPAGRES